MKGILRKSFLILALLIFTISSSAYSANPYSRSTGFDIKKNAFRFANYESSKWDTAMCSGFAMAAVLSYCDMTPKAMTFDNPQYPAFYNKQAYSLNKDTYKMVQDKNLYSLNKETDIEDMLFYWQTAANKEYTVELAKSRYWIARNGTDANYLTIDDVNAIKEMINNNMPVHLGFNMHVKVEETKNKSVKLRKVGHAVVAYSCKEDPKSGQIVLNIYDNNFPYKSKDNSWDRKMYFTPVKDGKGVIVKWKYKYIAGYGSDRTYSTDESEFFKYRHKGDYKQTIIRRNFEIFKVNEYIKDKKAETQ